MRYVSDFSCTLQRTPANANSNALKISQLPLWSNALVLKHNNLPTYCQFRIKVRHQTSAPKVLFSSLVKYKVANSGESRRKNDEVSVSSAWDECDVGVSREPLVELYAVSCLDLLVVGSVQHQRSRRHHFRLLEAEVLMSMRCARAGRCSPLKSVTTERLFAFGTSSQEATTGGKRCEKN